jgi:hypothetical protein
MGEIAVKKAPDQQKERDPEIVEYKISIKNTRRRNVHC